MLLFWNDLRYALRQLRRSPGFALTVVLTLALGIGLNSAIFAVVDCVLLRPLGYHDADRIVAVRTHFIDGNRSIPRLGGYDYVDLARQVHSLQAAAYYNSGSDAVGLRGSASYLPIAVVSPRFGQVLGVEPVAGRLFNPADTDGTDALVSTAFAREQWGSERGALRQVLKQNGTLHTVVGVLPDGFSFPGTTAIWFERPAVPLWPSRTSYSQNVVGKLRPGVSLAQLSAELGVFSRGLQQGFAEDRLKTIEAVPLQQDLTGSVRPTLRLLMGSVAVVLLIVCANITHLQLVRAARERRSVTIRTALGASRAALSRHALLEALLLACSGCIAAVLLAVPALRLLVHLAPSDLPRLAEVHLNLHALLFSFALSVLLMSVTSALPVWRSWHLDPASALRQDAGRGMESRGALRLRTGLLVAEVALTLTLSVGAVLLARQLIAQGHADLGFVAENLITLDMPTVVAAPAIRTGNALAAEAEKQNLARLQAVLLSTASVPGVRSAAAVAGAPMGFDRVDVLYAVRGRQEWAPGTQRMPGADISPVTPGFLATMGIPLLRGRDLLPGDRAGAPPVLLVSRTLARQVFPEQDPIGQQIRCGYDEDASWWTIVGVVGDIRGDAPGIATKPAMYIPVAQHPRDAGEMQLVIRTEADPASLLQTLRNRLTREHPEIAVKAATMHENISGTERADRFRTTLFASFAGVSLLLAAVGMYGVTAYSVAQRRFEFALRVALGASRPQMLRLVLRGAVAVAALGVGIGIVLSLALGRALGSIVGALPPFDAVSYAFAALAVLLLAVFATLIPARAAAVVDPMQVLRGE